MHVQEEIDALEALRGQASSSPAKVIHETWSLMEQALCRALPDVKGAGAPGSLDANELFRRVEKMGLLSEPTLGQLRKFYEARQELRPAVPSGLAAADDPIVIEAATHATVLAASVLGQLQMYKPRWTWRSRAPVLQESGPRRRAGVPANPMLAVLFSGLLVLLLIANFYWFPPASDPAPPGRAAGAPAPAPVLLGSWRRADQTILRFERHPTEKQWWVGFVVGTPAATGPSDFQIGDIVMKVRAEGRERFYQGYQKIGNGKTSGWRAVEFSLEGERLEIAGQTYERLPEIVAKPHSARPASANVGDQP